MELKVRDIKPYNQSVIPTIVFNSHIITRTNVEYLMTITGELYCGNKLVSILQPLLESNRETIIKEISEEENSKNYREDRKDYHGVKLLAELSEKKIEFLENERQSKATKSLELSVRLKVAGASIPTLDRRADYLYKNAVEELFSKVEIKQEEWLGTFSNYLGIGEYYLIELAKPNPSTNNEIWSTLYDAIISNINHMELELKQGNWLRTIEVSRQFFENIKIGDSKDGNKTYKDDLMLRMKDLRHDDEGINNLLHGVWQFFEYSSKFIHEKGRRGYAKPIPIPSKADAYFIYSLAINLTNVIFDKVNRNQ